MTSPSTLDNFSLRAHCECMQVFDYFFLAVFTIEMLLRQCAFGFYWAQPSVVPIRNPDHVAHAYLYMSSFVDDESAHQLGRTKVVWRATCYDAYLRNSWNQLDFFIVVVSWVNMLLSEVKFLKVLRLARTLRPLRLVRYY